MMVVVRSHHVRVAPGERLAYAQAFTPEHPTVYATTGHDTALIEGDLAAEHARYHPDHPQAAHPSTSPHSPPPRRVMGTPGSSSTPRACLPEFTGGSIVSDSITDYPRPTPPHAHSVPP